MLLSGTRRGRLLTLNQARVWAAWADTEGERSFWKIPDVPTLPSFYFAIFLLTIYFCSSSQLVIIVWYHSVGVECNCCNSTYANSDLKEFQHYIFCHKSDSTVILWVSEDKVSDFTIIFNRNNMFLKRFCDGFLSKAHWLLVSKTKSRHLNFIYVFINLSILVESLTGWQLLCPKLHCSSCRLTISIPATCWEWLSIEIVPRSMVSSTVCL